MKILPVIDLKSGRVVQAIAGQRDRYRPIKSLIATGATPSSIAKGLRQCFDCHTAYVADLDAITLQTPQWSALDELIDAGLQIWLDAGIRVANDLDAIVQRRNFDRSIVSVVVGLESLVSPRQLPHLLRLIPAARLVFSLDMLDGKPLGESSEWDTQDVFAIAQQVIASGIRRLIVLDLAAVGTSRGVRTLELCRRLRMSFADLEITSGGGVRSRGELDALALAGCDNALIASALHSGQIRRADTEAYNFF